MSDRTVTVEHTVKLPHGFRIECVTSRDREAGEIRLNAEVFHGSDLLGEHVNLAGRESFDIVADVIHWRTSWLNELADQVLA